MKESVADIHALDSTPIGSWVCTSWIDLGPAPVAAVFGVACCSVEAQVEGLDHLHDAYFAFLLANRTDLTI